MNALVSEYKKSVTGLYKTINNELVKEDGKTIEMIAGNGVKITVKRVTDSYDDKDTGNYAKYNINTVRDKLNEVALQTGIKKDSLMIIMAAMILLIVLIVGFRTILILTIMAGVWYVYNTIINKTSDNGRKTKENL